MNEADHINSPDYIDPEKKNIKLIILELLDLLNDERSYEDTSILGEIIKTINLLVKQGGSKRVEVISHPQLIKCLIKIFNIDTDLTRLLSSLLHDLSTEADGVRLLLSTGVISALLQSIASLNDDCLNFVLTIIRNCLICLNIESAEEIYINNGCITFISLFIDRHSNKQMNFLADCLLRLAMFNKDAQVYLQTSKLFLQELVTILDETNYNKLLFTLIRMLPLLSTNENTKSILIQFNIISILERFLKMKYDCKIQRYCLLTLRNLSNQVIYMDSNESLILILLQILSLTNDLQIKLYIADILSNLSCENQSNKSLMAQNNAVQLFINFILQNENRDDIIESAICTLRHLTGKCPFAVETREYIRINHGIPYIVKYLHTKETNWPLIKTCIGLIRNLALSLNNITILCEYRTVYTIGKFFLQMKTKNEHYDLFITTLFIFTRHHDEKLHRMIYEQIIESGCTELLIKLAKIDTIDRNRQMSNIILNEMNSFHEIACREMKNEKIKTMKTVKFLTSD